LRNTVEYAFVLARGKSIGPEHLPDKITRCKLIDKDPIKYAQLNNIVKHGFTEKEKLIDALKQADGNQTRAAKILGVSRVTVWKRIKKFGVAIK
jgi:transcriptional regulator of acetoin/glycerol metabolism